MPSFLHALRDKTRGKSHGKSHKKLPATPAPGPAEDTVHSTHPPSRDSPSQFTSRSAALDVSSGVFPPPSSAPDMDHPGQSSSSPPSAVPYLQPMSSISGSALHAQRDVVIQMHTSLAPQEQAFKPTDQPRLKRCPPSVHTFTGRQDILAQMHECFFSGSRKQHVFVLHGLGGAGKTQLALKFVEMCQIETAPPRFSNVYFIDASTAKTTHSDLRTIALAKAIGESGEDTLDWLAGQHEEWLLLLNNADDTTFNLRDYFPRCSHGNILVTSRNYHNIQHASDMQSSFHVSGMSPNDARDLLLKLSGLPEDTKGLGTAIVKELGHLALAVIQAGAYISMSGCGFGRYLEMYRERRGALLEEYRESVQKMGDYEWTVYTTWTISLNRLSQQSVRFLQLCAFLHHDGISETIFQNAASNATSYVPLLPEPAQSSESVSRAREYLNVFRTVDSSWDSQKFSRMIMELRSYSLVDLDRENETYSIHPLVHAWTHSTISDHEATRDCARSILGMSISRRYKSKDYAFRRSLLTHIDTVLERGNSGGIRFAEMFWVVYYEAGRWKEAEELQLHIKETYLKVLGAEHPHTLTSMGNLASTYWSQGRWKEAEELEIEVKETRLRVLGAEHPATLKSMGNLASTCRNQGRWKEAEELELRVKETCLRVFGAEHPDTLTSMGNLAMTYLKQGRWKEAEELQLRVKETCLRVFGAEHPDTLTSMGNLAKTYLKQGRRKEAEELRVQVKDTRLRVLGAEHPNTLTSMRNLALTYWDQGRWKEAEELQLQVKETHLRVFGAEHPDTLRSMTNLAMTYWKQGRRKEAEELQLQVKETSLKVLGAEHPDTLKSMRNLASIYRQQGRWTEVEELKVQGNSS